MIIKEKIVRASIAAAEKEIKEIDTLLNATPLSDIIRLDIETIEHVKKIPNEQAVTYLDKAIKKRKELLALAKKQIDCTVEIIPRKVDLQMELADLVNELYFIEQRKCKATSGEVALISSG